MQQERVNFICNSRYVRRIGNERFFISSSFGFCMPPRYTISLIRIDATGARFGYSFFTPSPNRRGQLFPKLLIVPFLSTNNEDALRKSEATRNRD